MVLPGSEKLRRYPHHPASAEESLGILIYGTSRDGTRKVYKIGDDEYGRAERLGYRVVRVGRSYIYVVAS